MFFPERITGINSSDLVLEVGPGGTPHPRSDFFLEYDFNDESIQKLQRGNAPELATEKPIVYYDGKKFPFADKQFDYVICSHVLEHIDDLDLFVRELTRVSHKGYIEYPTIYYEYLYNIPVHVNYLKLNKEKLFYLKKDDSPLQKFAPVHRLLLSSLENGYTSLVDDLKEWMFEGFEWEEKLSIQKADTIEELVWDAFVIERKIIPSNTKHKTSLIKNIFNKISKKGAMQRVII